MTWTRFSLAALLLAVFAAPAIAQEEGAIAAEFRREREALAESCGEFTFGAVPKCVFTLATANPLHVTFGTIAPGNGVAVGPAFVGHHTPSENLRITWSADVVASASGAWRGGAYLNMVPTNVVTPVPVFGSDVRAEDPGIETYPVYALYAQSVSLDRLALYGLGPSSSDSGKANWGMQQTVMGAKALVPIRRFGRLGVALLGSVSGRFFRVGDGDDRDAPPVSEAFLPAEAPGLGERARFVQFAEGVRIAPTQWARIKPSYQFEFEQFVGPADRSFNRWTLDLVHEFPFYRTVRPEPRAGNTPNDCSVSLTDHRCPSPSRNRYGAITFRALTVGSDPRRNAEVPFYLQPTLGGSDIDGNNLLTSFDDYRFRGPNMFALQLTVEHSLVALRFPRDISIPLGAFLMAEQGRVANKWGGLFGNLRHSYAAGLTIRAGGFPELFLLFAWGHEGSRFSGTVNPALLGGASRPSLQ